MKNIFPFIALMALVAGFSACDNEVDSYKVSINPITPDVAAAGVYEGTWERMLLSDSSVVEGEGRVVVESDTAYLVKLHFISEDFNLDKSAVANITYANSGFYYYNSTESTELKTTFFGSVNEEGIHSTTFVINQVENRRVKKFQYTFSGRKVDSPVDGEGTKE